MTPYNASPEGKLQALCARVQSAAMGALIVLMPAITLVGCSVEKSASTTTQSVQASDESEGNVRPPPVFSSRSKDLQGLIGAELRTVGATFDEGSYNTPVYYVGDQSIEQITDTAREDLNSGKIVILDSDGSEKQAERIKLVALELTGVGMAAPAMRIILSDDKSYFETTPIYPSSLNQPDGGMSNLEGGENEGNTVKNLFNL
jgi:hypothetical protein